MNGRRESARTERTKPSRVMLAALSIATAWSCSSNSTDVTDTPDAARSIGSTGGGGAPYSAMSSAGGASAGASSGGRAFAGGSSAGGAPSSAGGAPSSAGSGAGGVPGDAASGGANAVGGAEAVAGAAGTASVLDAGTVTSMGSGGTNGGGMGGTLSGGGGAGMGGAALTGGSAGKGGNFSGGGASGTGGSATGGATSSGGMPSAQWVGTWANGPQLTETANLPPSPGLAGNTLRQVVHVSIGGGKLRVKFSNAYGSSAVVLSSVHVAASQGGSAIDTATDRALTFAGAPSVTMAAGSTAVTDPFDYQLAALANLAVTIQFGAVSSNVTGHPGSRTTSYLQSGNAVTAASLPSAATADHWYILTGIDVLVASASSAIVTLGDSITDGRGSTTNGNDRWPDDLARRLLANAPTAAVATLNLGIGGNAVLSGGLGPPAVQRFDRDVLGQSGARWLVVLEGVNDIGGSTSSAVADQLIAAYGQFVDKAHAEGMLAYGIPILPFGGSSYFTADHETARQTVNAWIRTSGKFDAVIDLDAVVRDPANPTNLQSAYDSGDHLHLNPTGYQKMAGAIDLGLFSP